MLSEPRCSERTCKHFIGIDTPDGDVFDETKQVPVCAAFPEGIPDDIAYGLDLHLDPVKGDNGIQYEKAKPEDEGG
jgi:hypothetical protein